MLFDSYWDSQILTDCVGRIMRQEKSFESVNLNNN